MVLITFVILISFVLNTDCLNSAFLEIGSHTKFVRSITKVLNSEPQLVSEQCKVHLFKYAEDLLAEKLWALEMFDSNSKLPAGLLKGRLTDLGAFDECISVKQNINITGVIFGKYCLATIPLNLKGVYDTKDLAKAINEVQNANPDYKNGILLAVCMPHVCTVADIRAVYSAIDLDMNFSEDYCQTEDNQSKLDKSTLIAMIFFSIVLVIMIISTAYDVVLYYLQKKPYSRLPLAFSIFTNGKFLLSLSKSQHQLGCLHGLRVISTMWIIIRHRYSIQPSLPTDDYFYKIKWHSNEANMYMINAAIAVDTFFLLSGLLISYNYLTTVKNGIKFNILLHYIHRYVRLSPVIIALIVFYIALLMQVGSGPLWPKYIRENLVVGCETYWWKALLFIQNYGTQTSMCIPHSWYLCVDMQLFIISPILLLPMKRWPNLTITAVAVLTVCSAVSGFLVSWIYELRFLQAANTSENVYNYIHHYYFSTPVRAAPWLIGIILGYFIFKYKERDTKLNINKVLAIALWILSLATISACVLAGHDTLMVNDRTGSALQMALVKSSWALGISWIVYACVCGYGGIVNWFLSLPFFEVLSKLTYTLYLVHYALIYIMVSQVREVSTFGDLQAMHAFWGDFVFTLAISVVLMLSFELPMINLEKILLRRWEKN